MSSKQKHKLNKKLKYCRNCPTGRKGKSPREGLHGCNMKEQTMIYLQT
jgi:hypothetical protein